MRPSFDGAVRRPSPSTTIDVASSMVWSAADIPDRGLALCTGSVGAVARSSDRRAVPARKRCP
jgi:hypothetical protein